MNKTERSRLHYLWLIYLLIALAAVAAHKDAAHSYFQSEIDLIRANAARTLAEWAPDFSDTALMLNARALASGETFMPGTWLYHGLVMKIVGPEPSWHFVAALFVHIMAAWSAAAFAKALYGRTAAAWAGLLFAVHPALAGMAPGFANGPAMLAVFWVTQASLRYLRFMESGGMGQLIAAMLCTFLAVSTDGVGVFSIMMIACLELFYRSRGLESTLLSRLFSVLAVAASALLFYSALRVIGVSVAAEQFKSLRHAGELLRAMALGLKAMSIPSGSPGVVSIAAVVISLALLLAGAYVNLSDFPRLAPLLAFVPAILMSIPYLSDPAYPAPDTAVAYLCPALCFCLVAGDLLSRIKNRYVLVAALTFLATYFSLQTIDRAQLAVARGKQVRMVGDEIEKVYEALPGESDIYLIDDGLDTMSLLVGHLDFVYRYGLTHQTRFSFVQGGFLFCGDARSPVGRINHVMRLEINRAMSLVGWNATHEGLFILTPVIKEKIREAEKLMDETGYRIEPLSLGGEGAVKAWDPAPGPELIPPDRRDYHWFMEAPIFRLHPVVGRKALNY